MQPNFHDSRYPLAFPPPFAVSGGKRLVGQVRDKVGDLAGDPGVPGLPLNFLHGCLPDRKGHVGTGESFLSAVKARWHAEHSPGKMSASYRTLTPSLNVGSSPPPEHVRDHARQLAITEVFARSFDERKKVEMRFAHLKTHHRFGRMRLRGLSGAQVELHLAAIVQKLKTMALRLAN